MGAGLYSDRKPAGTLKKAPAVPGLKIVIVGDCEVGKTSIYLRFLHNQFCPLYVPTSKVNIDNVVKKMNQPSHALVSLTLWDVPGREDLSLHSTYFRDMDALIVVVDLTDETSIRMAPVWKQLALNNATVSEQDKVDNNNDSDDIFRLPGTLQPPVLLLGNKLDVIEEELLADLQAAEKTVSGKDESETTATRSKWRQPKLQKPACVQLLESVSEKAYFTGSAVVSAKNGDGSVNEAIRSFVRHILERHNMPRRFQPLVKEERQQKSKDRQTLTMDTVGIPEFDHLFSQGQVLVTRVLSLGAHLKETLQHFQQHCVVAKVVGGGGGGNEGDLKNKSDDNNNDNSLENCLVGLRDALKKQDPPITMKLVLKDHFCHLEARALQDLEIPTHIRYALKTFNKEFAAVCQVCASELPSVVTSLDTLDAQLARLCQEYRVPPSSTEDSGSNGDGGDCDVSNHGSSGGGGGGVVDIQAASRRVERNRARLMHARHQAEDAMNSVATALKKARTAVMW